MPAVTARLPLLAYAPVHQISRKATGLHDVAVSDARGKSRSFAHSGEIPSTPIYTKDMAIARLPRLGSGVRIPSPAPILPRPLDLADGRARRVRRAGRARPTPRDPAKETLQPDTWPDWERKTSYWPFGAIVSGKARIGGFSMHELAGGLVLWFAATWAHIPLAGRHLALVVAEALPLTPAVARARVNPLRRRPQSAQGALLPDPVDDRSRRI